MKILQVNCVYNTGSTGKIVHDVHVRLLEQGVESVVCYGRGARTDAPNVHKTCGELYSKVNNLLTRFTGLMYGGCFFSTNKLISIIKKEKPDVVHLHCINGYFVNIYRLITWLKRHRVKTVLTLHAEFMHTANCGHALDCEKWRTGCGKCPRRRQETKSLFLDGTARSWNRMKKAFDGFERDCIVTSVSPWLMERAKQSPILGAFDHVTVLNGLDTDVFRPVDGSGLRERCGIGDKKLVLHVTPSFSIQPGHLKGGRYVVELAKRMPEVVFAVVGCREAVEGLPDNVINVGRLEDQNTLAAWYSTADVTLLTSRRETFSMVTAESLCCGTPVVGFRAGAPETIAIEENCRFGEYGDLNYLQEQINILSAMDTQGLPTRAKEKYDRSAMCSGYMDVYRSLLCVETSSPSC